MKKRHIRFIKMLAIPDDLELPGLPDAAEIKFLFPFVIGGQLIMGAYIEEKDETS